MKNFCKEYQFQCLNAGDFLVENNDDQEMFIDKLSIIRFAMQSHVRDCSTCELDTEPFPQPTYIASRTMNWISVKDKLPKDDDDNCSFVWVYSKRSTIGPDNVFGMARWIGGKWDIVDDIGAHNCSEWKALISEDITHWMPLSEGHKE